MATTAKKNVQKEITITGEGKFPLVDTASIQVVEREDDRLFFNPRSLEKFTPEKMEKLELSIRADGLQSALLVRANTEDGVVTSVELIAGERRLRTLRKIIAEDLPCFDEDALPPEKYLAGMIVLHKGNFATVAEVNDTEVAIELANGVSRMVNASELHPTVSGSQLYSKVECRVIYDCSDERALRLAFTENDQSEPLDICDEVALVERLSTRNLLLDEIAEMLGTNVTWVSQTANFRSQLPAEAFDRLLKGTMARHVAVNILAYRPEDREALFEATVKAAEEDSAAKSKALEKEAELYEDAELLHKHDAKVAADNPKKAKQFEKKAKAAGVAVEKAKAKKEKVDAEKGHIKQGHVLKGAAAAGVAPKKAKMLARADVEELYVINLADDDEKIDPVCDEVIPADYIALVRGTAQAILQGNRDPLSVIRQMMIAKKKWQISEVVTDDSEDNITNEVEYDDYADVESELKEYISEDEDWD